ncbi:hypothetical protein KL920_004894 [Ogataea angusta]|nr:hypothetical protein KL920_004894 [Ogataea angusta]
MYSSNVISESLESRDNSTQGHETSKQGDQLGVGAGVGHWVGQSGSAGSGAGRGARGAGRRARARGTGGSNVSGADQAVGFPWMELALRAPETVDTSRCAASAPPWRVLVHRVTGAGTHRVFPAIR